MVTDYLPVSWNEYHANALNLTTTLLSRNKRYDEIVAISRGGLTFGHMLSDFLRIPVCTFTIQSFSDIRKQGEVRVTEELSKPIAGKRIVLVDDVSDSGKTLIRAIGYLKGFHPQSIETVTMFFKPQSEFIPDFYGQQTDKWIIFPYEVTETIVSVTNTLSKQGKTGREIRDFLIKLGYTNEQIAFVKKYHLPG